MLFTFMSIRISDCVFWNDKIIALVASYLQKLIKEANLNLRIGDYNALGKSQFSPFLGVVQTAYANGAATNYIKTVIGVPVECVPTGVKFLHHKVRLLLRQFCLGFALTFNRLQNLISVFTLKRMDTARLFLTL